MSPFKTLKPPATVVVEAWEWIMCLPRAGRVGRHDSAFLLYRMADGSGATSHQKRLALYRPSDKDGAMRGHPWDAQGRSFREGHVVGEFSHQIAGICVSSRARCGLAGGPRPDPAGHASGNRRI